MVALRYWPAGQASHAVWLLLAMVPGLQELWDNQIPRTPFVEEEHKQDCIALAGTCPHSLRGSLASIFLLACLYHDRAVLTCIQLGLATVAPNWQGTAGTSASWHCGTGRRDSHRISLNLQVQMFRARNHCTTAR